MLIKWLSSTLWDLGWFYLFGKMFLEFAFLSGNLLLKPNLASRLSFIRVLLELEQYWHSHIILALARFWNHVLFVHKFFLERAFKSLLFGFEILIFFEEGVLLSALSCLIGLSIQVSVMENHLFVFSQFTTSCEERKEIFPVDCGWLVVRIDSEQDLIESFLFTVNWLPNEVINPLIEVGILADFDQEIFAVYLVNVFSAFFFRLHETASEVIDPLAGKVHVDFLLDVLKSVFLNHGQYPLHTLLNLLFLLIFDQLTIQLNFYVLRANCFCQDVKLGRLK